MPLLNSPVFVPSLPRKVHVPVQQGDGETAATGHLSQQPTTDQTPPDHCVPTRSHPISEVGLPPSCAKPLPQCRATSHLGQHRGRWTEVLTQYVFHQWIHGLLYGGSVGHLQRSTCGVTKLHLGEGQGLCNRGLGPLMVLHIQTQLIATS